MARRRAAARRSTRMDLTPEEIAVAAVRMLAAAQAHQRASVWCMGKPDAKPPNIDAFFFGAVSVELVLLSVEQSLRLMLLLHYEIVRDDTNHNSHVLYATIRNKSGGKDGIRKDIIGTMTAIGRLRGIEPFSERELLACLNKHDSSYSNFRYFQLDHEGRLNEQWEYTGRDVKILHCFALALIALNMGEMERRGNRGLGLHGASAGVGDDERNGSFEGSSAEIGQQMTGVQTATTVSVSPALSAFI